MGRVGSFLGASCSFHLIYLFLLCFLICLLRMEDPEFLYSGLLGLLLAPDDSAVRSVQRALLDLPPEWLPFLLEHLLGLQPVCLGQNLSSSSQLGLGPLPPLLPSCHLHDFGLPLPVLLALMPLFSLRFIPLQTSALYMSLSTPKSLKVPSW